jgi:small subunit ribosomal protein S20
LRKNKSAIKKAKQGEARRLRNLHVKSTMKTYIKRVVSATANNNRDQLDGAFKTAESYIFKAASKGVIHRNNAARKVSRLSKRIHSLLQTKE